jgi:hypothetical protein
MMLPLMVEIEVRNPLNPCQQSSIPNLKHSISNYWELVELQCTGDWVNNDALGCMDQTSCTYDNKCVSGECIGTPYPPINGVCYTEAFCHGQGQYRTFDFIHNDSVVCSPDPLNSCVQPSYCTNWTTQCPINVILPAVVNLTDVSYEYSSLLDLATMQALNITVNGVTVSCGWLNYTFVLLDVTHDADRYTYGNDGQTSGPCPSFQLSASNVLAVSSGLWHITTSFELNSLVSTNRLENGAMILGLVQLMNSQQADSYYCTPSLIYDITPPSNGSVRAVGVVHENSTDSMDYWNNCNNVVVEWQPFDDTESSIISYTILIEIDLYNNGTFIEWTQYTLMDTSIYQYAIDLTTNGTLLTIDIINGHHMKVYVIATNGVGMTTTVSASLVPFMIDCTPAAVNFTITSTIDNSIMGGLPHYDHVRYLYNPSLSLLLNVTFDAMHLYNDFESSIITLFGELQVSTIGSSRWQRAVSLSGSIDDILLDRYASHQVISLFRYPHWCLFS